MHTNYTNNTNKKILSILLLGGFILFDLISISYAAPPKGLNYPYKLPAGRSSCLDLGDNNFNNQFDQTLWCVPRSWPVVEYFGTGGCRAGLLTINLLGGGGICYSENAQLKSVKDLTCPSGAKKFIKDQTDPNSWVCVTEITDAAKDCPLTKDRIQIPGGKLSCIVQPISITGAKGDIFSPDGSLIKHPIRPYNVSFPIPCKVILIPRSKAIT